MNPDEYGICVVSGFVGSPRGSVPNSYLHADAYVYVWGGRNVAAFNRHAPVRPSAREIREQELRAAVREDAEAWIEAHA